MTIRREDTPYMDDSVVVQLLTPHRATTIMLNTIAALIIIFIVWAMVARVDEVTRGEGQVVPSSNAQIIQSLEGGILQELLVQEGDIVKKGQVLLRISDVMFASEERGTEARFSSLQIKKARLEAESNGANFEVSDELKNKAAKIAENEVALYQSRQKELQNALSMIGDKVKRVEAELQELKVQMSRDSQNIGLLQQELAITSKMVAQNAVPKIEEIRLRRELSNAQGSLNSARERQSGLQAQLSAANNEMADQKDKFKSQVLGELNAVETEIAGLQESLKTMGDRVDRAEIKSPVDGVVNNIHIKTIGGIIEPAMKVAEIVPIGEDLKINARVAPDQIAFLKTGQPARVRITAYDSQRYGYLNGTLVRVGANSVSDAEGNSFFEIEVQTEKSHLGSDEHPLPITSGMVAQVDVLTGKRTIMMALLRPVLRMKDRALTER